MIASAGCFRRIPARSAWVARTHWPENSSWDFVAVGRGHDVAFWTDFLAAIKRIDPDMAVNIEHEDQELGQLEGLEYAAKTLLTAAAG